MLNISQKIREKRLGMFSHFDWWLESADVSQAADIQTIPGWICMTCIPADTAAHPRIVIGFACRATGLLAVEVILESWWRNMIVLLLSSTHFLQEGDERHESIIVSGIAELLHETLGFLLAELLSEVGEEKEKLVLQDGVVVIFVVQLHDLNKVVEASLVLGVLAFPH